MIYLLTETVINMCKIICGLVSGYTSYLIGDVAGNPGEVLEAIGTANDQIGMVSDEISPKSVVSKITKYAGRLLMIPAFINNYDACMSDCTTTYQDKIFSN
jgi:hypothetical protein